MAQGGSTKIISMIKWIRASRSSIKASLSQVFPTVSGANLMLTTLLVGFHVQAKSGVVFLTSEVPLHSSRTRVAPPMSGTLTECDLQS